MYGEKDYVEEGEVAQLPVSFSLPHASLSRQLHFLPFAARSCQGRRVHAAVQGAPLPAARVAALHPLLLAHTLVPPRAAPGAVRARAEG